MKLDLNFYVNDVLEVAPNLIGKILVRKLDDGQVIRYRITETEAYRGEEDTACHARVGKTKRTSTLYEQGGCAYVYLCYGIHYLFNVVTGPKDHPEAVLIRGIEGYNGPGKLTKVLDIDAKMNGIDLVNSDKLWIEDDGYKPKIKKAKRVGIDYATKEYRNKLWRFMMAKNRK